MAITYHLRTEEITASHKVLHHLDKVKYVPVTPTSKSIEDKFHKIFPSHRQQG